MNVALCGGTPGSAAPVSIRPMPRVTRLSVNAYAAVSSSADTGVAVNDASTPCVRLAGRLT